MKESIFKDSLKLICKIYPVSQEMETKKMYLEFLKLLLLKDKKSGESSEADDLKKRELIEKTEKITAKTIERFADILLEEFIKSANKGMMAN